MKFNQKQISSLIVGIAYLMFMLPIHANAQTDKQLRPQYSPDEIVFKLSAPAVGQRATTAERADSVALRYKLNKLAPVVTRSADSLAKKPARKPGSLDRIYRAYLPTDASPAEAAKQLMTDPAIEWAEPVYYRYSQATPNDPQYPDQDHFPAIRATGAWDITTGSHDVIIAIIDTGVEWKHPDLAANIWINQAEIEGDGIDNDNNGYVDDRRGWDFVSVDSSEVYPGEDPGPPDNNPVDFHGHGTHVAGIVGAVGNNGIGISGINWQVSLMAVRAGYKTVKGGGLFKITDIANALVYATDNGADIVNMSFGGYSASRLEREALDYASSRGVLLVASAGNDHTNQALYPARFDNVLAVTAINQNALFRRATFSNFGIWTDIAAPGVSILSTVIGGGYGRKSGTSMASPVIAGVAGLIKSAYPNWDARRIAMQLRASATSLNDKNPGLVNLLGAGLVTADDAIKIVSATPKNFGVVSTWAEETSGSMDGWFDTNETISLLSSVRNFASPLGSTLLTLNSSDENIDILDNTTLISALGGNLIDSNWDDPQSVIKPLGSPYARDHIIQFEQTVTESGVGATSRDDIYLRFNPWFDEQRLPKPNYMASSYASPQILTAQNGGLTVIYNSLGFIENEVYSQTLGPTGIWSDIVRLSDLSNILAARRQVGVVDSSGAVHVIFMGVVAPWEGEIFYTRRDPITATWSKPEQISSNSGIYVAGKPVTSHAIAVDQNGHPHVAWVKYGSTESIIMYTFYNGTTWSSADSIGKPYPSPLLDPQNLKLIFNSSGTAYLLWGQAPDRSIYMMTKTGATWGSPKFVYPTSTSPNFSIALDSYDTLHMVSQYPDSDDVAYSSFNGTSWSARQIIMQDTYVQGVPLIGVIAANWLQVLKYAHVDNAVPPAFLNRQVYETTYLGHGWSPLRAITFDRIGEDQDLPTLDFAIDASGHRDIVRFAHNDLTFMTTNRDPARIPSRPVVIDDGDTTPSSTSLHSRWTSSHPDGIKYYEYAIGTAPGEADVRYWSNIGLITNYKIDLSATPLKPGQRYYVSIRALGNNGFWSPVGVSDGIELETGKEFIITPSDMGINVHFSNSDGSFSAPALIPPYRQYGEFAIGDFTNDGQLDFIATFNEDKPRILMFERSGPATFTSYVFAQLDSDLLLSPKYGLGLTAADLDNDGDIDFLHNLHVDINGNIYGPARGVAYLNNGNGSFTKVPNAYNFSSIFTGHTLAKSSNVADVDGDGLPDMLASKQSSGSAVSSGVYLLRGNGDGTFQPPVHVFTTNHHPATYMSLGDFNNDGRVDAIVGHDDDGDPGAAFIFYGYGDGTFAQTGKEAFDTRDDIESGTDQPGLGLFFSFDANHDGMLDIIAASGLYELDGHPSDSELLYLNGLGNGTFSLPMLISPRIISHNAFTTPSTPSADVKIKFQTRLGDIDGDGDVDLDDLKFILAGRNTPALKPLDPWDLDFDGMITVLDARILAARCTRPRCATQ